MSRSPLPIHRRSVAVATTAVIALSCTLISGVGTAAIADPGASRSSITPAAPTLTPATFAEPPTAVRPMYRYWMPLAYTDDDVLRSEVRDMASAGAGGVEVAPFVRARRRQPEQRLPGRVRVGNAAWAHKIEVITDEAAKLGLSVDQSLGPQYPPTVPSLNSFNQPEVEQQLIYGREFHAPGESRSGALPAPTTTIPSVSHPAMREPAAVGEEVLQVRNLGGFAPGDVIMVGSGPTAEQVTVTSIGDRLAECAELGVSEVANVHATDETVRNVAAHDPASHARRPMRRRLHDQWRTGQMLLDPSSVVDVTDERDRWQTRHTLHRRQRQPVGAPRLSSSRVRADRPARRLHRHPAQLRRRPLEPRRGADPGRLLGPAHLHRRPSRPTSTGRPRARSSRTRSSWATRRSGRGAF